LEQLLAWALEYPEENKKARLMEHAKKLIGQIG
jgi:hypothetical protein